MNKLLTKLNNPTLSELYQMRAVGVRYYRQCIVRYRQGELFYPFGLDLKRSSFEQTLTAVLRVLSSLDMEVDPNYPHAICGVFYDLHFRGVPMQHVAEGRGKYYIHNYFEMRKPFHIYEIEDVWGFYQDKRKHRGVSLVGVDEPVNFDSLFYATTYHPHDLTSYSKARIHPHYTNCDWQIVLARVLKSYYQFELNSPPQQSGVVLPFTRK